MQFRMVRATLLFVSGICATVQCGVLRANAAEHPKVLLVYPHATGVSHSANGPSDQLTYHVEVKFPASNVIGWISYKLQKEGWEPLTNDFSNPQLPSSHVRGWGEVLYGPNRPGNCVHVWMGDWSNPSGDIVHYDFRYEQGERCTPDATDLKVTAMYVPSAAAQRARQVMEDYMKHLGQH